MRSAVAAFFVLALAGGLARGEDEARSPDGRVDAALETFLTHRMAGLAAVTTAADAARVLGDLGALGPTAAPAVPAILRALRSEPLRDARPAALHALARVGPAAAPAVPDLLALVRDQGAGGEEAPLVEAARVALRGVGVSAIMPAILEPSAPSRAASLAVVLELGDEALALGAPALVGAMIRLPDDDEGRLEVRRIGAALSGLPGAVALPPLVAVVRDGGAPALARARALDALGVELMTSETRPERIAAIVMGKLLDPASVVRAAAARAIRRMAKDGTRQPVAAVPFLAALLGEPEREVRHEALGALAGIVLPSGCSQGSAYLDREEIRPEDRAAVIAMRRSLGDPDPEIRASAAGVIGLFGVCSGEPAAREALPAIVKLIDDPDESVRDAAKKAAAMLETERAK